MNRPIFTFDTTHHALWAEEIAKEFEIPHEIVPAPPESNARCDIAIETLPDDADGFSRILGEQGVEHRLFAG
ncbi:MAG: DUF3343 domain-containing protein [Gemmatimonas sp.]|nr:DUF3343 domain-containing protein [Gemmatimonas sp.]